MTDSDTAPPFDPVPDVPPASAEAFTPADSALPRSFPWPPSADESVFDAWGRTWSGASLAPRRFFAALPRDGSLGAAILYFLSIGIPAAGAQLFWSMVRGAGDADPGAMGSMGAWSPLLEFLFSPLWLLLSLFLSAGAVHLLLLLFGAGAGGYKRTVRVFAFAYSPQILAFVPVLGPIAGFVWMVVIAIVGVREAHETSTARAAAAILIPLGVGVGVVAVGEMVARAGLLV